MTDQHDRPASTGKIKVTGHLADMLQSIQKERPSLSADVTDAMPLDEAKRILKRNRDECLKMANADDGGQGPWRVEADAISTVLAAVESPDYSPFIAAVEANVGSGEGKYGEGIADVLHGMREVAAEFKTTRSNK